MTVNVSVAGNYIGKLGRTFGHVEIEMQQGATVELADGSAVTLTEFGLIVEQPGAEPNQFVGWNAVRRIVEAKVPLHAPGVPPAPEDGQAHD
jgi:hypothetical protein